jgi:hypothetical protein
MNEFISELINWLREQSFKNSLEVNRCSCFDEIGRGDAYEWCKDSYDNIIIKSRQLKKKIKNKECDITEKFISELISWLRVQSNKNDIETNNCSCFDEISRGDAYEWCKDSYDNTIRKIRQLKKKYKL